jgi:hypothetical protein
MRCGLKFTGVLLVHFLGGVRPRQMAGSNMASDLHVWRARTPSA